MKSIIPVFLMVVVGLSSCQRSISMVPPTTRTIVAPEGSEGSAKSWSRITEQEGNAVLGPLSNMRR
ncbi:MAG: hypothetical protein IKZ07_01295 [Akkermansia sp.]|nr:hypothetical protein [Akkermansia sp.]